MMVPVIASYYAFVFLRESTLVSMSFEGQYCHKAVNKLDTSLGYSSSPS